MYQLRKISKDYLSFAIPSFGIVVAACKLVDWTSPRRQKSYSDFTLPKLENPDSP